MKNNYRAGRRLEYLARDALVSWGYVVVRSSGSHGPADLVAIGSEDVRVIQVKSARRDVPAGIAALRAVSVPANASVVREVWARSRHGWEIVRVE